MSHSPAIPDSIMGLYGTRGEWKWGWARPKCHSCRITGNGGTVPDDRSMRQYAMPTLPNQTQPFLKLSTSEPPTTFVPKDQTWSPSLLLSSTAHETPRTMADFGDFSLQESQLQNTHNTPRYRHEDYSTNTHVENNNNGGSFNFSVASPQTRLMSNGIQPVFDTVWEEPSSTTDYIPNIHIDTSVNTGYSTQQPQSCTPSLYMHREWGSSSSSHLPSSSNYSLPNLSPDSASYPFDLQPTFHTLSPGSYGSPSSSSDFVQSSYGGSSGATPTTPNHMYGNSLLGDSPVSHPFETFENEQMVNRRLYSHREQLQFFKEALSLPMERPAGPFIPQQMYRPHTNSDRRRYVEEVDLEEPIYFWMENPDECGIPLIDALHSRVKHLRHREDTVFQGRGPSISVRLQWPGYRQWSRQIPTKDFRSPPGPITMSKLAKNVAKCVQRFIDANKNHTLEDDADVRWKVGTRQNEIKLDDLILVSMHHVSMGSWQPQLRLSRPLS